MMPDSCGVLARVNAQGRAIKVAGDSGAIRNAGVSLRQVAKYLDRVYAPVRILFR